MAGACADEHSVATAVADDESVATALADDESVATALADDESVATALAGNEDECMQEPGGKLVQHSWSKVELGALKRAVALHGRDWVAVASSVGSRTVDQCKGKVRVEVAAGRMQEPGCKQVQHSWSKVELGALTRAVDLHGRDWAAVASSVGSKTRQQCLDKVRVEVAAGSM